MNNNIPKIIHYCWFGKSQKSELILKCIDSWKKYCPDYKIIEWNEDNFNINMNSYVKEAYNLKKWAFVSDFVRLYVIYNNGGIYLDTDVELIKPIDCLLNCSGFFSTEDNRTISTGLGFGAVKGNLIVKKMLDDYLNEHFVLSTGKLNDEPCPIKNTRSIKNILDRFENRKQVCIFEDNYFYPTEYFCPLNNSTGKLTITNNTYAIHHYSGSWLNKKELKIKKRKQKITKLFGRRIGELYTFPYRVRKKIKIYGFIGAIKFSLKKIFRRK